MELPPAKEPETAKAEAKLKTCSKCQGYPVFHYEPGCTFSTCVYNRTDCPCLNAVPDFDPIQLTNLINKNNKK